MRSVRTRDDTVFNIVISWMSSNLRIFSFVWLGLTKVSQAAAGKILWIVPSKHPRKHP